MNEAQAIFNNLALHDVESLAVGKAGLPCEEHMLDKEAINQCTLLFFRKKYNGPVT